MSFAAARRRGAGQGFIHDAPDRARATSALGAASEAIIDLAGRARDFAARQRRAHVMIGEDVAGADDHCREGPAANWYNLKLSLAQAV